MCQDLAWGDASVLPCTSAELDRNPVFRRLLGDLGLHVGGRSAQDHALALLLPEVRLAMRAYYAGRGGALDELLDVVSGRVLDRWLSAEIVHWSDQWNSLDPTRAGAFESTREALAELSSRIGARSRPPEIVKLAGRLQPPRQRCCSRRRPSAARASPGRSRSRERMNFDYKSLVEAYFSRAHYASAADELREYHQKMVDLLERELNFSLSSEELIRRHAVGFERGPDEQSLECIAEWFRWVADLCVERHAAVSSPFPVRVEGQPSGPEAELEGRHKPRIENAMDELRGAQRALLEDIIVCLDPEIVHRRVPANRLYELGLPEQVPDPLDFI
jgi:hypothetical protein